MSLLLFTAGIATAAAAQSYAPVVTMSITPPGGKPQEFTVPESGIARLTASGTEYEFRPTIQDSSPWTRVVVTIFKAATAKAPTEMLGQIEVKTGAPAVDSKTKPAFRIAVPKVAPPPAK